MVTSLTNEKIPIPHPLPNKPLAEVIFELRWSLFAGSQPGFASDPGFRIFFGRYYDRIRGEYPHIENLPASQVPEDLTGHTVRHQFWKSKNEWPVTQVGPGILTVNETEGYLWDTFRPRLVGAITALYDCYPTDIAKLAPEQVSLKYIDVYPLDPLNSGTPLLAFLRQSLHTKVELEPLLFKDGKSAESPFGLNLNITYQLERPQGVVVFTVANGTSKGTASVISEISVLSKGTDVPGDPERFGAWLDDAHIITDQWFFTLTRGRLLESFEAKNANEQI